MISDDGIIYRTPTARMPALSGRSAPRLVVGANSRDLLYLFEKGGSGAVLAVHTIPESDDSGGGKQFAGLTAFGTGAELVAGLALPGEAVGGKEEAGYLVFVTKNGMVKKTDLAQLPGPSARPFEAINIARGDSLGWVQLTHGKDDILLLSRAGQAIRFKESDVRAMGLSAAGVMGMRLDEDSDWLVGMGIPTPGQELLIVTEDGQAKRCQLKDYPTQGRYGKGVICWKSGEEARLAGGTIGEAKDRVIVRFARSAPRSLRLGDAPKRARASAGKQLFELASSNRVTSIEPAFTRPDIAGHKTGPVPEEQKAAGKKSAAKPKPAAAKAGRKSPKPASKRAGKQGKASSKPAKKKASGGRKKPAGKSRKS